MPELTFVHLNLPRPLSPDTVLEFLTRLMTADAPRPLAFEVHAGPSGVAHLVGAPSSHLPRLKRHLAAVGATAAGRAATRADVAAVARVVAHPGLLPLAAVDPETLVAAVLAALTARHGDERIALQLNFGRTRGPQVVTSPTPHPLQPLSSRLIDGIRDADTATRRRMQDHANVPSVSTTLRIGVSTGSLKRDRALVWEVFGALQQLEAPGARLTLSADSSTRWRRGTLRAGLRLTARELLPLLVWPLGDRDYPGIASAHPRQIPVPEIVSRTEAVFAVGTAPGSDRPVGLDSKSRLQHLVALGPTGSGKSTLLLHLVLADIRAGRACVVLEPKRQLVDAVLGALKPSEADDVVVLDASDTEAPVGFNPLDVGHRDPDIVVDGIVASLAAVFEDGWGPRTEYLIHGGLLSLARAGQVRGEPYTLIDLPRLLTDAAFRRPVVAAVQNDATLGAFWAEYEELAPAQRAAMIAAPLNKLRKLLLRPALVRVLGQPRPRFRLRDVFRERKTVLIPLNDALVGVGASRLLGSLVVAELFSAALERAAEMQPETRPGFLVIDEVQQYLNLPTSVGDALSTFRSYGVGLTLAHQHRSQLPPAMRRDVDVNARNKIVYALGPVDARDMAQQTPHLTADDFQGLAVYEVYAHLLAGGVPAGWLSARTLPAPPGHRTGGGHPATQPRPPWGAAGPRHATFRWSGRPTRGHRSPQPPEGEAHMTARLLPDHRRVLSGRASGRPSRHDEPTASKRRPFRPGRHLSGGDCRWLPAPPDKRYASGGC